VEGAEAVEQGEGEGLSGAIAASLVADSLGIVVHGFRATAGLPLGKERPHSTKKSGRGPAGPPLPCVLASVVSERSCLRAIRSDVNTTGAGSHAELVRKGVPAAHEDGVAE